MMTIGGIDGVLTIKHMIIIICLVVWLSNWVETTNQSMRIITIMMMMIVIDAIPASCTRSYYDSRISCGFQWVVSFSEPGRMSDHHRFQALPLVCWVFYQIRVFIVEMLGFWRVHVERSFFLVGLFSGFCVLKSKLEPSNMDLEHDVPSWTL